MGDAGGGASERHRSEIRPSTDCKSDRPKGNEELDCFSGVVGEIVAGFFSGSGRDGPLDVPAGVSSFNSSGFAGGLSRDELPGAGFSIDGVLGIAACGA